jgi:hypothetical protein
MLEDERPAEPLRSELSTTAGCANSSATSTAQAPGDARADLHHRRARRHRRRGGDVVERQLPRDGAALHQQHPAARRRHPSGGLPRRADPHDEHLCPGKRHREEGKGQLHRRRRARGADLRAVGQGAGPEVLQPDQGQAGLVRGAPGGRIAGRREAGRVVRGEPRPARRSSARSSRPRWRARPRARPAN